MKANIVTSTIEMTKTEAAAAGKLNSAEFADLKQLRETFPTYKIMIVKPAAKKVDHFKGLTLKYMEDYIKRHNKDVLVEFYKLCGKDESGEKAELAATATYGEIKMWFLTEFPEIEQMSDDVNEIIENARASRAARKAS
mgnify:FL=1